MLGPPAQNDEFSVQAVTLGAHTADEYRREYLGSRVDERAFASDADGCERIVSCDHSARKVCGAKGLDGGCRPGLELVLEDNETKETQSRFSLLPTTKHVRLRV